MAGLSLRLRNRLGLAVSSSAGSAPDVTAPSGYAIAFQAASYTEGVDDAAVDLDVTGAEVGATWDVSVSSDGGGTPVTDSGTVASASFTISALDLTGLSPGTLTASLVLTDAALNAGSPATDTATLSAAGYAFTNAEAETVVNAFSVEPGDTRKELIDDLVGALKAAGVWSKMDLLYVMAAADEQSAKINWKNPGTNNLTNNNSTTFTADVGFTGNGSNMNLSTGISQTALTQYQQNTAHAGVWCGANIQEDSQSVIGTAGGGGGSIEFRVRRATDTFISTMTGGVITATGITNAIGHSLSNRSASNAVQLYKNGSSVATDTDASVALLNSTIHLLRYSTTYSAQQVRIAHIGSSLTGTEVTDTYNAFNTYLGGL